MKNLKSSTADIRSNNISKFHLLVLNHGTKAGLILVGAHTIAKP